MNILRIEDINLENKRTLIRVDFNVPIKDGHIEDDTRIIGALPTIKDISDKGAKVILMSHLGNPKEKTKDFSLKPVADHISKLLEKDILFIEDYDNAHKLIDEMNNGDIALLENLRFNKGEKANDPDFAKLLASFGDVYFNDAFGTAHRKHASVYGIVDFIAFAGAGRLMEKEIEYLSTLDNPQRPYTAIMGGAKVSTKIDILKNLIKKVDRVIIGGGMAFTFMKAQGSPIGASIVENDKLDVAYEIMRLADKEDVEFLLPIDLVCAEDIKENIETKVLQREEMEEPMKGLDIGPLTISVFNSAIKNSGTIVWNGPMGVFETKPFDEGTKGIIEGLKEAKNGGAIIVAGGGDTVSAIKHFNAEDSVSHISTGGGSFLEFMSGKTLPAIEALTNFYKKYKG